MIKKRRPSLPSKKWDLPVFVLLAVLGLSQFVLYACAATTPQTTVSVEPVSTEAKHWSYTGDTGPEYWYRLDPAYAMAQYGKSQSPIDIITSDLTVSSDIIGKPVFAYQETQFEVENNGHTIELVPMAPDNYITIDSDSYVLQQFHFHSPSEHQIDGKPFVMELHLVHKSAQGNLAVLGIMITEGAENEVFKETFAALPQEITHEGSSKPEVKINLADLFSGEQGMYRYEGSLTTPPCSEGVKWSIATQVIELSSAQIHAFNALYTGNKRPLQPRYERTVYFVE
ncbi:MAG: carbonic anhydrase family protein [Treponema sp.]|jgi:carbonic anhydrase|nr:carbonic anhydrase family protein [Treponema sp.]